LLISIFFGFAEEKLEFRTLHEQISRMSWLLKPFVKRPNIQVFLRQNPKKIEINNAMPDQPLIFPHDPKLMRRAVSNLVNNALADAPTQSKWRSKRRLQGCSFKSWTTARVLPKRR